MVNHYSAHKITKGDKMTHLHGITAQYMGPTNTRGSRVKLTSCRFNNSIIIPYDYSLNSVYEMAQAYLEQKRFNVIGIAEIKNGYMLLSDTFQNIK